MKNKVLYVIFFFLFFITLTGCQQSEDIDIKNSEVFLQADNQIDRLNGKWDFFRNQLLYPKDIPNLDHFTVEKMKVPGYWENRMGYGTYHLIIHFPNNKIGKPQALYLPKIYTAYRMWIDGGLVSEVGKVAITEKSSVPFGMPNVVYFNPSQKKVHVLIQVSNYYHRNAGITGSVYLGNPKSVDTKIYLKMFIDWFSVGALIVIGINQLNLYFINRKRDNVSFYFSLFCQLIGVRVLLVGDSYIFHLFPNLQWELVFKLIYIITFMCIPLFINYFSKLFPNESEKTILKVITIISFACILLVLFTGPGIFTNTVYILYLILLFLIPYFSYVLIKAILQKQEGSRVVGALFVVLIGTVINDLLNNEQIIHTMLLLPLGLVAFCGAQSYLVYKKYSKAFKDVEVLSNQLEITQKEIVFRLGEITETRSKETGNHVRRVAEYSQLLGLKYGLSSDEIELLKLASPLHDIGKIAIPDTILNKPGKLTSEEFDRIKTHTEIGYQMLKHSNTKLMETAAIIAYTHHEKYDGTGYPRGLKETEIPIYGRITAVADVFDALISERVYKKPWEIKDIIEYFTREKGKHFDPFLTEILLNNVDEFLTIKDRFKD
jgi:HD superfamily phosphodiesterase